MAAQSYAKKSIITRLFGFSLFISLLMSNSCLAVARWKALEEYDIDVLFSGKFKPEAFWAKNYSLLNSTNALDRVVYFRHTLDLDALLTQGYNEYGFNVVTSKFSLRNKAIWGDPSSIVPTTRNNFKLLNAIVGDHNHETPRNILWIKELWIRFTLGEPIGLGFTNRIELTLGSYPFQLGRGISLGDAYAVAPEFLGFYSDGSVDQYAYGALLSGDILADQLSYDLYGAILQDKSASLSQTGAKVRSQEYGRRMCPARGFGVINFVLAGRLNWLAWDRNDSFGDLNLEPYWMFNYDPEQQVEFPADASSKLGTVGLAGEWKGKRGEAGFDLAFNLGHQNVRGWDRNHIELQNRNGVMTYINTHVLLNAAPELPNTPTDLSPYKAPEGVIIVSGGQPSSVGKTEQKIINSAQQAQQFNSDKIGNVPGLTAGFNGIAPQPTPAPDGQLNNPVLVDDLYNAFDRFRDPYVNQYQGWMLVADAAYWAYKKDLKVAAAFGVASGDEDPNFEELDGTYDGFIGLQEIYSGKRVRSAFLLGAGKVKRLLSKPIDDEGDEFNTVVTGFTDLVHVGVAYTWTPTDWEKRFSFNQNVLSYWAYAPPHKFGAIPVIDPATGQQKIDSETGDPVFRFGDLPSCARSYLGTEVNIFTHYYLLEDLKWYVVWAVFFPGSFYCDIRGKPLSPEQAKALDAFDPTDFSGDALPNIGTDTSMTFNMGIEYQF